MAATAERNPFRPGPGTWPPVLAGRESERSALGAIVSDLLLHRADPIHLMEAPRGMGKTVLLLDLERSVPDGVDVVRASAADLPSRKPERTSKRPCASEPPPSCWPSTKRTLFQPKWPMCC